MKKNRIRVSAAAMALIFGSAVNASAFDIISINDYWQKKEIRSGSEEKYIAECGMNGYLTAFSADSEQENTDLSEDRFDLRRLHKYLGYVTLILAGVAAVSSSEHSVHYGSAYAATGTAIAAGFTGYLEYGPSLNLRRGLFSENNLHVMFGVLGTIGVAAAVAIADSGEGGAHAGIGSAAAASMLFSVLVIKW